MTSLNISHFINTGDFLGNYRFIARRDETLPDQRRGLRHSVFDYRHPPNPIHFSASLRTTIDTDLHSLYNEGSSSTHGRRRIRASDRGPALFFSAIPFILFVKASFVSGQHHRIRRHQLIHMNITIFIYHAKNDNIINLVFREPD